MKRSHYFYRMHQVCIAIICLLMYQTVHAQTKKLIEVDTLTNSPKEPLPFDRPFMLKVRVNEAPKHVYIIENRKRKNWKTTITKNLDTLDSPPPIFFPKFPQKTSKHLKKVLICICISTLTRILITIL